MIPPSSAMISVSPISFRLSNFLVVRLEVEQVDYGPVQDDALRDDGLDHPRSLFCCSYPGPASGPVRYRENPEQRVAVGEGPVGHQTDDHRLVLGDVVRPGREGPDPEAQGVLVETGRGNLAGPARQGQGASEELGRGRADPVLRIGPRLAGLV